MSEILSPGKGRRSTGSPMKIPCDATQCRVQRELDPRRVWMEGYAEDQKHVRIRGSAKSNEDVAEFLKRLNSSVFFGNVNWTRPHRCRARNQVRELRPLRRRDLLT